MINKKDKQNDDFKNVISNTGKLELNFVDPFQDIHQGVNNPFKGLKKSEGGKK